MNGPIAAFLQHALDTGMSIEDAALGVVNAIDAEAAIKCEQHVRDRAEYTGEAQREREAFLEECYS
jgi:hypothetical protein